MLLEKVKNKLQREGVLSVCKAAYQRVFPPRCDAFEVCKQLIAGKSGLEIGGPSQIFSRHGLFPAYQVVKQLDNCNFHHSTVWEGEINEGQNFKVSECAVIGHQYVAEAWNLVEVPSGKYDFILSSHMIEHTANPIRAIFEWVRVLSENGTLVIIFPHKDGTFDHNRSLTSFEHLIQDFSNEVGEDDLTHLAEILEFHDLSRDPGAGTYENFVARSKKNIENRCLHHHSFDTRLAVSVIDYMNLQIRHVEAVEPYNIVVVAQKMMSNKKPDNRKYLTDSAVCYQKSPFKSDAYPLELKTRY